MSQRSRGREKAITSTTTHAYAYTSLFFVNFPVSPEPSARISSSGACHLTAPLCPADEVVTTVARELVSITLAKPKSAI